MPDPHVFTSRSSPTAALVGLTSFFGRIGIMAYYTLFLQGVQGTSSTLGGQMITPLECADGSKNKR